MTQVIDQFSQRRQDWVARVHALVDQVTQWSQAAGWQVEREDQSIEEDARGMYQVPALRIRRPDGELFLKPIARDASVGTARLIWKPFPHSPGSGCVERAAVRGAS